MPYSYSCTISSLVKILFVQLRYLYIQYAWISIMKKKNINQNMKVERTRYFSKCLAITITGLNFFNCPAKLKSNLKLKFRSKFNHGFTNHGYLLFEKLFIILRQKGPRRQDITTFSIKLSKIMRSLRSSKCLPYFRLETPFFG